MLDLNTAFWRGLVAFLISLALVVFGWALFSSQVERSAPNSPRSFQMGLNYWTPLGEETPSLLANTGVGITLENSEHILVQVPWSPNAGSALKTVGWLGGIAKETNHDLSIALDWMDDDRTNLRSLDEMSWSFEELGVRQVFIEEATAIAKNMSRIS